MKKLGKAALQASRIKKLGKAAVQALQEKNNLGRAAGLKRLQVQPLVEFAIQGVAEEPYRSAVRE